MRLTRVITLSVDREREGLQARRRLPRVEEQPVQAEQDGPTVNAAREGDAKGGGRIVLREPAAYFGAERFDIVAADDVEVRREGTPRRIEEATVHRVGVGASDEAQRGDVVGGHHARIAGMELTAPSPSTELGRNLVDSFGDDQDWALSGLGEKVPEGAVQATRQMHLLLLPGDERERPLEGEQGQRISVQQAAMRFVEGQVADPLCMGREEIDDRRDVLAAHASLPLFGGVARATMEVRSPLKKAFSVLRSRGSRDLRQVRGDHRSSQGTRCRWSCMLRGAGLAIGRGGGAVTAPGC